LVERGLLNPGALLYDARRRYAAQIRADGSVVADRSRGSIHQVGAAVQGAPACNGWTFWCFEDRGQLVPIDLLRQKLRAELN
ncbi:MAG: site-specific DNA-methyltransferase, partial [Rhodospirillaceae bacterium]|nr:site-specific DNA-methyltransferase [Rhodospirillaceae bacterium]